MRTLAVLLILLAAVFAGCTSDTTPTPTSTPATSTPATTGTATKTYHEDFDDATVGTVPNGWTSVSGKWRVDTNATAPSAPNVVRQSETDQAFPYLIAPAGTYADGKVTVLFDVLSGAKAQAGGVTFRFVDKDNNYVARANGNEGNFALFHTIGGKREKLMEAEAPTGTNTWLSITAEFTAQTISIYSNTTKLFTYTETAADAPRAGSIGLWTKDDSVTLFDNFDLVNGLAAAGSGGSAAAPSGPTSTNEAFDDLENGALPDGWVALNGTWAVATNASAPTPNKVLQQSATDRSFPLIVNTDAGNYTDVEVATKFNVINGTLAQAGGVAFRVKDANNYYVARANGNEANYAIFHTINGKREKMAEGAAPTGLNTWLSIRVEAKGNHITLYAGNTKVVETNETNADAPTSGYVGLWTKDDSIVQFDDFEADPI